MDYDLSIALERERRKIAQILHDELCQDLQGLHLLAEVHAEHLSESEDFIKQEAEQIRDAARKSAEDLRTALELLRA